MTETLQPMADEVDQEQLAEQLLAQAKEQGIELIGPNGLLNQLTKNVLETALDAEMTDHLDYEKYDAAGGVRLPPHAPSRALGGAQVQERTSTATQTRTDTPQSEELRERQPLIPGDT